MKRKNLHPRICAALAAAMILMLLPAAISLAQEDALPSVTVYSQPASASVIEGGWSAVFSVSADGAEAYQWQSNAGDGWKNIAGQTKARLTRSAVQANNGVRFRCVMTGPDGKKYYSDAAKMTVAGEGGIVKFGRYEQDNNKKNGAEPIEWQVLKIQRDKALLISRYVLDAKPFHKTEKTNKWEKCSLRTWLNGAFFETVFDESEREAVLVTQVDNGKAQSLSWKIDGGKNTSDKLFLLSEKEAWQYFKTGKARVCKATDYARARGVLVYDGLCEVWWLRSPANTSDGAATVYQDGGGMVQVHVYDTYAGVRPALWVDLDAELD